jgi:hypothetical protein
MKHETVNTQAPTPGGLRGPGKAEARNSKSETISKCEWPRQPGVRRTKPIGRETRDWRLGIGGTRMRQTNPILPGPDDSACQTKPIGSGLDGSVCQTKPIGADETAAIADCGFAAREYNKQSQLARARGPSLRTGDCRLGIRGMGMRQTNPISPGPDGWVCQTKPICGLGDAAGGWEVVMV